MDFRWILDALPVGVWVAQAPGGEVVYANPEFRAILGMEAVQQSKIEDASSTYRIFDRSGRIYPVHDLPFSRVVATGRPATNDDLMIQRPDGRKVNVRAFAYPVNGADGNLTHVIVAFIDITGEVEAELERQRTEARLTLAINHAPVAIWATDANGVVTMSEGAALQAIGAKSGYRVGENVFELFKDHPTIPGYIRRGLAGESFWYTLQSGNVIFDTWLSPIHEANGEIAGVTGVANDVSEIRALQARTIQDDRAIALGALAASVAHEINNPLTYVLGHQELLKETLGDVERILGSPSPLPRPELQALVAQARKSLEPAHLGAERIASITRAMQTFSRPATQQLVPIDARNAVDSVLKLVGKELEARARVELRLDPVAPVLADSARLGQVVMNLLVNAMQALEGNRKDSNVISVRTGNEREVVVIEIADSGPGVAPEDRDRVFEPFVTTKEVGVGSGLGLFVCRNIVRDFSGRLSIGDRVGGGAVFRVELPAARAAVSPASAPAAVTPSFAAKILIVEDEYRVAEVLARQLSRAGHRAFIEQDSREAVKRIAAGGERFDLVFCDLMMKSLSGMDVADLLATRAPAELLKVVFMTGGAFTERARTFRENHAAQCVDKPFDIVLETTKRLNKLTEE